MIRNQKITLSDEQYILLNDAMRLAIAQQRNRLGRIYSGEVFQGGEKAVRAMEEKVSRIIELRKYIVDNTVEIYEDEKSESSTRRILTQVAIVNDNENMLWVYPPLYEFIKNNPDEIIVESQCRPPIMLKAVGVGK